MSKASSVVASVAQQSRVPQYREGHKSIRYDTIRYVDSKAEYKSTIYLLT